MNEPSRERRLEEIVHAYLQAIDAGQAPDQAEVLGRHPEFAVELREFFADQQKMDCFVKSMHKVQVGEATIGAEGSEHADLAQGCIRYFGDYELLKEIARGGMGVVYQAKQVSLNRIVALKMIVSGHLASSAEVQRFRAEAEAAANLDHANIVPIYEIGEHEGQQYFSMKLIEGSNLATLMASLAGNPKKAVAILSSVARAVHYAHQRGILHRDLKPANILVDGKNVPMVTDFGLAKRVEGGSDVTRSGAIVGTPSYMAPEQAKAQKGLSTAVDVYGLGAILFEMLTGRPPFKGDTPLETLVKVVEHEPDRPSAVRQGIDRDLETICLKCLEKDPQKRYPSAEALAEDLDRWSRGEPIEARPVSSSERAWRWCRRNPVVAGLTAALVLALVCGSMISTGFGVQAHQEAIASAALTLKANKLATDEKAASERASKEADRATRQERLTRRHLYFAHMHLADQSFKNGNLLRAVELLQQYRNGAGDEDVRSFEWGYLWQQCNRQRKTIPLTKEARRPWLNTVNAHGGPALSALAISPNGQWIALGIMGTQDSIAGEVRLLDLTSGTLRKSFLDENKEANPGPAKQYQNPVFSADSKLFAMVEWDTPIVWRWIDDNTRESGHTLQEPRLMVWELDSMTPRTTIPLSKFATSDRIALTSKFVAASFFEQEKPRKRAVNVWELPADKETPVGPAKIYRPPIGRGEDEDFHHFTFTPDGKSLAWAQVFGETLRLTKFTSDGIDLALTASNHKLAFSPDGKYIAVQQGQIRLRDARTGKILHEFPYPVLQRYTDEVLTCFSPDSQLLAIARKNVLEIWDVASKKQVGAIRGPTDDIRAVGFGGDSKTVITVSGNNEAKIWDVTIRPGPDEFLLNQPPRATYVKIVDQAISPDSKTLATVWCRMFNYDDEDRIVLLNDLTPESFGKEIAELKPEMRHPGRNNLFPSRLGFSPDGKRLYMSGLGAYKGVAPIPVIQLWEMTPDAKGAVATLTSTLLDAQRWLPNSATGAPCFSRDGTKLAYHSYADWNLPADKIKTVPEPDRVQLFDVVKGDAKSFGTQVEPWFPHPHGRDRLGRWGRISRVVAGADGKRIFSVHEGGYAPTNIVAWDADTGLVLAVLDGPMEPQYQAPVLLSPDDKTLATTHSGNSIYLWDVAAPKLRDVLDVVKKRAEEERAGQINTPSIGKPRAILRGHSNYLTALAFHPDGKVLASGSHDRTIKLWDIATGELRLTLEGHDAAISTLAFTPDGNVLISCDEHGVVKHWRGPRVRADQP